MIEKMKIIKWIYWWNDEWNDGKNNGEVGL